MMSREHAGLGTLFGNKRKTDKNYGAYNASGYGRSEYTNTSTNK